MAWRSLVFTPPLVLVLASACAAPPPKPCPAPVPAPVIQPLPPPEPDPVAAPEPQPDLDLFLRGVAELRAGAGPATLDQLRREHLDSPFVAPANRLIEGDQEIQDLRAMLARAQQDHGTAQQAKEELADEVEKLKTALEKLEHLAIESEMRAK